MNLFVVSTIARAPLAEVVRASLPFLVTNALVLMLITYVPEISLWLPRLSYRGEDVVASLEQTCAVVGYPRAIRVDQGSEFISRDLDLWAYTKGVTLDFSRPGKPTDNAFIEAFNGRFRAEYLNAHRFLTLADAREKLEA
jgi:transposase InsO family protein